MSVGEQLTYLVSGMTCGHCEAAVKQEIGSLADISEVDVDLGTKLVRVAGVGLNDEAIRAAIDEAGFEVVPA